MTLVQWIVSGVLTLALVGTPIEFVTVNTGALTPRPDAYVLIAAQEEICVPGASIPDTVLLFYGIEQDIRWVEMHVMTPPQLVGIATYAPGVTGAFQSAEILFPSGKVVRFTDAAMLVQSYPDFCHVILLWLTRT